MVEFQPTMSGFDVIVNDKIFGRLSKEHGFFTDPTVIKDFMEVSPSDLLSIALRADEVKRHGDSPPQCLVCGGTPNFPQPIQNPEEHFYTSMIRCAEDAFHEHSSPYRLAT